MSYTFSQKKVWIDSIIIEGVFTKSHGLPNLPIVGNNVITFLKPSSNQKIPM